MEKVAERERVVPVVRQQPEQVVLHGYPPLIFIWPLIVLGYLFYFTETYHWLSARSEAWVYMVALIVVLMTIGMDMNRNVTIFWIVLLLGGWFAALWLRDAKGFTALDSLRHWIGSMQPVWSRDFGLIISMVLTVLYLIVLVKARLNDRWRFINNEIEHWAFGSSDDAMGRGAKRISTTYPDTLEFLLLMAGTITVYSAQGRTVLASIPRVPFLPMRARRISRILESVAVSQAAADSDELDHEHHDEESTGDTQQLQ